MFELIPYLLNIMLVGIIISIPFAIRYIIADTKRVELEAREIEEYLSQEDK